MIGVIANLAEHDVVREFFELFKTPWEFYRKDGQYQIVLCANDVQIPEAVSLVIQYGGKRMQFDDDRNIGTGTQRNDTCILSLGTRRLPIYGHSITFPDARNSLVSEEKSGESAAYLRISGKGTTARIGYDLFAEVRRLLTVGQPSRNASMPALELHIALLRDLITGCGISLIEIPPVPDGYPFLACLTHDVDHPSIRPHKWDHTSFGFVYRAVFSSLRQCIRGRITARTLLRNWRAAFKLPFVYLGLAKDFWREFDDQYLKVEKGLCSTFFVIPFKNCPGKKRDGSAPAFRAAKYQASDIADAIRKLGSAGCEVGLHGINAWFDPARGREELAAIRRLSGNSEIGVRMHWLYFDEQSPEALEKAEAVYDSTVGYNETVGYRAGTTQAYKPLKARQLLELPLHAMDTALFYSAHLGLSSQEASARLGELVEDAVEFGGCFTINWHDRSLAPERMWDSSYCDLLQDLKSRGAWFSTAGRAVSWFRKRRSVVFETDSNDPNTVRARVSTAYADDLPGLRLRIHKARQSNEIDEENTQRFIDMAFAGSVDVGVACGVGR